MHSIYDLKETPRPSVLVWCMFSFLNCTLALYFIAPDKNASSPLASAYIMLTNFAKLQPNTVRGGQKAKDIRHERSCLNVKMTVICGHREGIAMVTATLSYRDMGREMRHREDKYTRIIEMGHICED